MPFCEDYLSPKPSQSLAGVRILRAELEQAARQKVYRHISRDARKPCLFCRTVRERREREGRRSKAQSRAWRLSREEKVREGGIQSTLSLYFSPVAPLGMTNFSWGVTQF